MADWIFKAQKVQLIDKSWKVDHLFFIESESESSLIELTHVLV